MIIQNLNGERRRWILISLCYIKVLICSAHHSSEEERLLSRGSAMTEHCMFSEQKTISGLAWTCVFLSLSGCAAHHSDAPLASILQRPSLSDYIHHKTHWKCHTPLIGHSQDECLLNLHSNLGTAPMHATSSRDAAESCECTCAMHCSKICNHHQKNMYSANACVSHDQRRNLLDIKVK